MISKKENTNTSFSRKTYLKHKAYVEKWNGFKDYRYYLAFSLFFFGFTIHLLLPFFLVTNNSLVPIKGKIDITRTHVLYQEIYSDDKRTSVQSIKSILAIRLKGIDTNFEIMKNIGHNNINPKFESIITALLKSKEATVWIKKSEQKSSKPRVLKIDAGDKTVLSMFESISEHLMTSLFLLLMGGLFLAYSLWWRRNQLIDKEEA